MPMLVRHRVAFRDGVSVTAAQNGDTDVAVYKSAHVSSENLLVDSHSAPNVPKLFHP